MTLHLSLGLLLLTLFFINSCATGLNSQPANKIAPFSTDGCSASPEGTPKNKTAWIHCCIIHDVAYWEGGPEEARDRADNEFRACIDKTGNNAIASLYYYSVRAGGSPALNTPWRWGYGWPFGIGHSELTEKQKKSVEYERQFIPQVIQDYLQSYSSEQ
jgi:hypothetical protein